MNIYAAVDNNDNKTAVSDFVSEVYPNLSAEEKEQLTEKLYEEKYGNKTIGNSFHCVFLCSPFYESQYRYLCLELL